MRSIRGTVNWPVVASLCFVRLAAIRSRCACLVNLVNSCLCFLGLYIVPVLIKCCAPSEAIPTLCPFYHSRVILTFSQGFCVWVACFHCLLTPSAYDLHID